MQPLFSFYTVYDPTFLELYPSCTLITNHHKFLQEVILLCISVKVKKIYRNIDYLLHPAYGNLLLMPKTQLVPVFLLSLFLIALFALSFP